MKIPWKNLYSEPVVAKVDGVYILARPNTGDTLTDYYSNVSDCDQIMMMMMVIR